MKRSQIWNQIIISLQILKQVLQIASEFDSRALKRIRLWTHFAFFTNQVLTKTSLSKTKFCIFLQRKNAKFGSFVLSYKEWIWENKLEKKQILKAKSLIRVCQSTNFFHDSSVFELTFLNCVRLWINIFTTHQVFK